VSFINKRKVTLSYNGSGSGLVDNEYDCNDVRDVDDELDEDIDVLELEDNEDDEEDELTEDDDKELPSEQTPSQDVSSSYGPESK
jgi:hypothetical protein